jgi:hypothetical protein
MAWIINQAFSQSAWLATRSSALRLVTTAAACAVGAVHRMFLVRHPRSRCAGEKSDLKDGGLEFALFEGCRVRSLCYWIGFESGAFRFDFEASWVV